MAIDLHRIATERERIVVGRTPIVDQIEGRRQVLVIDPTNLAAAESLQALFDSLLRIHRGRSR